MPAVIAFEDAWYDGRRSSAVGVITFTGNYPTGGDTLDLSPLTVNGAGIQLGAIQGTVAITLPGGNYGLWVDPVAGPADPGGLTTGKLKIFSPGGTELSASAYPAALLAGPNYFFGCFRYGTARS